MTFIPNTQFEEKHFVDAGIMKVTFEELQPMTGYEIKVSALSGNKRGDFASLHQFTRPVDEIGKARCPFFSPISR